MLSYLGFKIKSLISGFLQPLFDVMAPEASPSLFPTNSLSVTSYESLVSGTYIVRKDKPYENAEHYRVQELSLYKCRIQPYHEYVVAHVVGPHTKSAYLRLERTRFKPKDEPTTEEDFLSRLPNTALADAYKEALNEGEESRDFSSDETATPSPSHISSSKAPNRSSQSLLSVTSNSISQSSESVKNSLNLVGNPAEDTVIAIDKDSFANDERQDTLAPQNLPLARLACLAQIVHEEDPIYNVFSRQCYWYANLIMKVIERESKMNPKGQRREGEKIDFLRLVRFRRGTWWRIPVGRVEKKLVDTISETFLHRWQQRVNQIQNRSDSRAFNHSGQRSAEERRPVTEERMRTEEGGSQAEALGMRIGGETERPVVEVIRLEEEKSRDALERENASLRREVEALRRQQTQVHHGRGLTYPPG